MSFQTETERLIIRDVREDDIPILVRQCAEPEARNGILSFQADEAYNRNDLANAIAWAKVPQRQYYKLSVALKSDGALIGSCIISKVAAESFQTSIGWHYGNQYSGNGYATEAARQLLYIGFELNKVAGIYADCFEDNKASIRIMEKIGMSPVWNFSLINWARGLSYNETKPTIRYSMTRQQWFAKQEGVK
jgi:[ribosomal protein S5]-alanine N-acetyltransferase